MIKTEHLTKHYGSLTAVEDVSFQVGPGEVLGFLGPNAAGKTTTMRMLAGFVTPTSGRASICGHDRGADARDAPSGTALDPLQLGVALDNTVGTLSRGFRPRVGLAQAIVHAPPV